MLMGLLPDCWLIGVRCADPPVRARYPLHAYPVCHGEQRSDLVAVTDTIAVTRLSRSARKDRRSETGYVRGIPPHSGRGLSWNILGRSNLSDRHPKG